jgi:hypothetical protein
MGTKRVSINFNFDIGDEVEVIAIEMTGRVTGLLANVDGKQYQVAYWNNRERKCAWMLEWEIQLLEGEKRS